MRKKILIGTLFLVIIYLLLMIPDASNKSPIQTATTRAFLWNSDSTWQQLEKEFQRASVADTTILDSAFEKMILKSMPLLQQINTGPIAAADKRWDQLLHHFFKMAPIVAVRQTNINVYTQWYRALRQGVKEQSQSWDLAEESQRNRLYALLYGMRAAYEEVLLQMPSAHFTETQWVSEVPSATPVANILGIPVHSGDLLVSRGGAAVSAFIARGNDHPGNFSHVALLYVLDQKAYLLEAHIEKGVAVSTVEEYIRDKKLRFMVLRPTADLPEIIKDPLLPHKAAKWMHKTMQQQHIPYDFTMNANDSKAMFCSEVASAAYRNKGISLWSTVSTISSTGVVNWLNDFGVQYFVTQMPADLEYDPQLSVVAEWRDANTLLADHIDNAVMDAWWEKANAGMPIRYNPFMLPVARLIKGWSLLQNLFGKAGKIPEGMSATQALKNLRFEEMHREVKLKLTEEAQIFKREKGYTLPYWQLFHFAEMAVEDWIKVN